jgi:hypothetical protein
MEDTLLGVPVTRDLPCSLGEEALQKATAEKKEIETAGLTVTGIHISSPDSPVHFFVKFTPGQQSWETRAQLEKAGYAVRQKMAPTDLCFFVTKALVQTKGWAD